jgi:hypothetical protein
MMAGSRRPTTMARLGLSSSSKNYGVNTTRRGRGEPRAFSSCCHAAECLNCIYAFPVPLLGIYSSFDDEVLKTNLVGTSSMESVFEVTFLQ